MDEPVLLNGTFPKGNAYVKPHAWYGVLSDEHGDCGIVHNMFGPWNTPTQYL